MDIETIKLEILREASKHGNQICKLRDEVGEFVKVKRGYGSPDELRAVYLEALKSLINGGLVRHVFTNKDVELFEMTARGAAMTTVASAKERITAELLSGGRVYKIHSEKGEFVQCGALAIDEIDSERILYMQALHELLHHGMIQVASDNHELASYRLDLSGLASARQPYPQSMPDQAA
jgi:hypothetical protein